MARQPKKLPNPVISDSDSAAILAGLGLSAEDIQKATKAKDVKKSASVSAKRTRQVAEIKSQARTRRTLTDQEKEAAKKVPTLGTVTADELGLSPKNVRKTNRNLRGIGVTGVTMVQPGAITREGLKYANKPISRYGDESWHEVGTDKIPDHFQAFTNLHNDLTRAVEHYEQFSTPDFKGHFERIRSMLADAQSDVMSAQGAHNQGRRTPNLSIGLRTSSTPETGNTRFNTGITGSYVEHYPTNAGEFGARNLGAEFQDEPSSASEYLLRAANGFSSASKTLEDLTHHISVTPSQAAEDVIPNTPVWERGEEASNVAKNIAVDYVKRHTKSEEVSLPDSSIVDRYQPQEGSQIERLYPGVTSRGREQDAEARRHQDFIENVVNARRPVIRATARPVTGPLIGPRGAAGNFYTAELAPKPAPLIAQGPLTKEGKFFSTDRAEPTPMRASEEIAREQRTGMRTTPRVSGRNPSAEELFAVRGIPLRADGTDDKEAYEAMQKGPDYPYTTFDGGPHPDRQQRQRRLEAGMRAKDAARREAISAGTAALSPRELADREARAAMVATVRARSEALARGEDVPVARSESGRELVPKLQGPTFFTTVGKGDKAKQVEKFYTGKGPQERTYRKVAGAEYDIPKMTNDEGESIASQTPAEEAMSAVKTAAYRHWQKTTGNIRPAEPNQGMMTAAEFAPIREAHRQVVEQHRQAFRRSKAYRDPRGYLQSKGVQIPSKISQVFGYSGAPTYKEPNYSTDELGEYVSPRRRES